MTECSPPVIFREEPIDYGALDTSLRKMCVKGGLKDVEGTHRIRFTQIL